MSSEPSERCSWRRRYVHGEESFPYSITLLIAMLLQLLGLVAIIDMVFRSGPLG